MPRSRNSRLTLALAALLALTTACAGAGTDTGGTFTLKVTDPGNSGPLAVGKRDGTFDKALAPLGARIAWVPSTPGFSSNLKLFNTKQLDVSGGAYSPVIGALSKDVGVRIVAVADPVGKDQNGILATPKSGIKSVRDLAGKRIAVNPAGKGEYITLLALAQAGVPVDQVERVPLQQADATSAFATGQVDAWASFNEPYQEAKANGGVEIATEQSIGSVDNTIVAFRTEVLDSRPDVAAKYLETLQQLTRQQRENPADFENVFEKAGPRALSGDRLRRALALGAQATAPRYPGEKDLRDLESVANLFAASKVTPRTITAADVIYDLPAKLAAYREAAK
ncbi:NrtA/SsuA/CpmA family ABC transporter substrate-binding protein [Amycolatopsis japonica]|uniref:NrtA/SsuA/CpmA family ABC transporter substrate-binding protein n=1 Tax=Amycolatopsis japonica TaxID=208439 RepID=UPI003672292B